MHFKDSVTFIKSFLKEPKKILTAAAISGSILVGSQKVSSQSLQFIKPIELNPTIYREGHVFSSKTYGFEADSSTTKFLEQAFEYRYGQKFKKENQYNFAVEVGRNNLYLNGKLVPDLTFARIYSTLYLSDVLKTPLDVRLGYSKEISNFTLKDVKLLDKTSFQASVSGNKLGSGVSLKIDNGKLIRYDGIVDVKFDKGSYSSGLRLTGDVKGSKFLSIQGHAQIKEGKVLFMPMAQFGMEYTRDGKRIPFLNYALYYVPNNKVEIFVHRNVSNNNKSGFYLELNYILGKSNKKKALDPKVKEVKLLTEKTKEEKVKEEKIKEEKIKEKRSSEKIKSKRESFLKELFLRNKSIKTVKPSKGYPMISPPKRKRPR